MLIMSEEGVSVACDPMFVGVEKVDVVVGLGIEMKLEVGAKVNEAIGSSVEEDETVVEVLDVVGKPNEKTGKWPVEVAGSKENVSDVVEIVSEVVVGAEEDDSCVVERVVDDVSNDEGVVETVLDVGVDIGGFSADDADTDESTPLPVAPLGLSGSCPEIAASSPWVCKICMM